MFGSALGASASAPTGDYVEARTASVFAGACHYSGEYVSDGREAVLAWHFKAGDWHGVSLAGLSAVAVVRADNNLAEADRAPRDGALCGLSRDSGPAEGAGRRADRSVRRLASARSLPHGDGRHHLPRISPSGYRVVAPQVAALSVDALPNRECCKQPNLVWYKPLAPVTDRRVGYTQTASVTARTGGDAWTRGDENSAFYGTFTL